MVLSCVAEFCVNASLPHIYDVHAAAIFLELCMRLALHRYRSEYPNPAVGVHAEAVTCARCCARAEVVGCLCRVDGASPAARGVHGGVQQQVVHRLVHFWASGCLWCATNIDASVCVTGF